MLVRLDRRGMMMIKEKLRLLLTALNLVEEGKRGAFQKRHVVRTSCSLIKVWCMLISNAWLANLVNQLHNSWQDIMLRKCTSLLNFFINEWLFVSNSNISPNEKLLLSEQRIYEWKNLKDVMYMTLCNQGRDVQYHKESDKVSHKWLTFQE